MDTEAPLTSPDTRAESEELTTLWNWLWLILVAIVILLLVLLLKRRSRSDEMHGELPLAAYPEARGKPKPQMQEHDATTAPPPPPPPPAAEQPAPSPTPGLSSAPAALAAGITLAEPAPEPEEEPPLVQAPPAATPEKPEEEEVDLDLGLDEFKDLPELDDVLVPGQDSSSEQLAKEDEKIDPIAAFWEELDTNELGEIESQPEQSDEDQSLEILLEMARAYVELGDRDEAVAILQQAHSAAEDDQKRARIQEALDEI